jgi:hypothetical protein
LIIIFAWRAQFSALKLFFLCLVSPLCSRKRPPRYLPLVTAFMSLWRAPLKLLATTSEQAIKDHQTYPAVSISLMRETNAICMLSTTDSTAFHKQLATIH